MNKKKKTFGKAVGIVVAAGTAVALLTAGCASSAGGTGAAADGSGPTTHSAAMSAFALAARNGHLADGSGKSVYMFASDSSSKSTCNGACATYWPPVKAGGTVAVSGALQHSKLGSVRRSDGTKQLTYAGYPLYYYVGDTKPGDTNGQGLDDFGAYWWLLGPSGKPLSKSGGNPAGGAW